MMIPTPAFTPVTASSATFAPQNPDYGIEDTAGSGVIAGVTLPLLQSEAGVPLLEESNAYIFQEGQ